jgi:tetratricopeptide (TPR) repeat protein
MNEEAGISLHNDTKSLEDKGWQFFEQKRYDDAISLCDKIFINDKRQSVAAFQCKIASLRKKGEFEKAFELFKEAIHIHPNELGILSERFWVFREQNKCDEAIDALEAIYALDKKSKDEWEGKWNEDIFLSAITLLANESRFEDAQRLINQAISEFNESPRILDARAWLHFNQMHYEEAIEVFKDILNKDSDNESALQGQIASLRKKGLYMEATDLAKAALIHLGDRPGINSELGWINFEQGLYDKAEEYFTKVLKLKEKDASAYIQLAWSLFRQHEGIKLNAAIKLCREALKLEPNLAEAFGCLGNISFRQGHIREAEEYFLRSIKSNVKKGHYADLGALYIQMGRYDEAKENLDVAIKNNPNDTYAHLEMGYFYLQTEKLKDAIKEFRIAEAIDPNKSTTHNALAIAFMEDNKLAEAEKVLRKALKSLDETKRWELHLTLCRLLARIGDETNNCMFYDEALKESCAAINLEPGRSEPHLHAGIVNFKRKDFTRALRNFQLCLTKKPYQIEAELNAKRVQSLIIKEKKQSRVSNIASLFLAIIFLTQLIALWILRFRAGGITDTVLIVLLPILLGLMVVAILLPGLTRFKITGLEIELCEPVPKESIVSGPKGEVDFNGAGSLFPNNSD